MGSKWPPDIEISSVSVKILLCRTDMNPKNPYWSPLCATEDLSGQEFFQVQLPIPAVNPSTCARMPFRGVAPAPSGGPQPTLVPPYAQGVLSSPYWTAPMPKHGGQRQRSGAVGGVHTRTLAFSGSPVKMSQVHEMRRGKAATALSSRMNALWTPKMVRPAPPYHLGALIRTFNKPHVAQPQGRKHELLASDI